MLLNPSVKTRHTSNEMQLNPKHDIEKNKFQIWIIKFTVQTVLHFTFRRTLRSTIRVKPGNIVKSGNIIRLNIGSKTGSQK